jgi:ubiquinone/menaquinone biosynthesis C-methylase UbiE
MNKGVDKIEFWKDRIEKAGRKHYSVYITSEGDWQKINQAHEKILKDECKGKVLDAGCGYGRWSVLFDDYVGTDFSPDFIAIAQKENPTKTFIQADLKALPFKDGEFDVAFCVSIKHMIEGNLGKDAWLEMEKELLRVAKKLVILEYTDPENYDVLRSTHN